MKVLFTGGRFFNDVDVIRRAVAGLDPGDVVIHGACRKGADKHVDTIAEELGFTVVREPANWGGPAGHGEGNVRNQRMLDKYKPDCVIAFWDGVSPGTRDMLARAIRARVPYVVHAAAGCFGAVARGLREIDPQGRLF